LKSKKRNKLAYRYIEAKDYVRNKGFENEIKWQKSKNFNRLKENEFLKEISWVILTSGFRESIIRNIFDDFSEIFFDWKSSSKIVNNREYCKQEALELFNHNSKIQAIIDIAKKLNQSGFQKIKNNIKENGVDFIKEFPYMGPATSYHFAKNIGFDVIKPDRHLINICEVTNYQKPKDLCIDISIYVEDPLPIIDIVLWRFCTIYKEYKTYFSNAPKPVG
jgi:hypothetical protein